MKKLSIAAIMISAAACGDADRTPKGILGPDEMKDILVDLNIAEAYGNNMPYTNAASFDSLRQEKIKIYSKQVLDLHHVSVKEFYTSYTWYEDHPDRLKAVMQQVQEDITKKKNKAPEMGDQSAPLKFRLRIIFPYAEKHLLVSDGTDTIKPFIRHQSK
ncbi:DUF4296 domain-containing protein [Chitinophaga sp. Cy-1792]|uniref:DUF4296 domain-containing protein n=1 Tax=Chitinophaga sp. Cy-1792 TaxID=2608339 RepID=UPI00142121FE|nr:DUF4296 domain-containing protein [Chitinophaga sp. Cy-1792]